MPVNIKELIDNGYIVICDTIIFALIVDVKSILRMMVEMAFA